MPIGIVTGLRAEARIARRCARLVGSTGGVATEADATAGRLLERGATALVSFGIAGGLSETLPTGTLVVATGVIVRNATIETDTGWRTRLLGAIPGAVAGLVLGSDRIIGRTQLKADLFQRTGALAVDLESGGVARAAAAQAVPFVVLRAIADAAACDLPPAALVGLDRQGGVAFGAVLASLWREPGQLARLFGTAGDTRAALRALAGAIRPLGAEFGLA